MLFVIKTPLRGRKDPLKFASLPTCGFVAQLVERPTSIWEARVQAPSKPEFFFQASLSAISLIAVYLRGLIRHILTIRNIFAAKCDHNVLQLQCVRLNSPVLNLFHPVKYSIV